MTKKELKKLLSVNRREFPYEPQSEEEAREIAEIAIQFGHEEPEEALSNNYVIRCYLRKKHEAKVEAGEREEEIQEAFKEEEALKKATGLDDRENVERLRSNIASEEYKEQMKVGLGLKPKFDKEEVKKKVQSKAKELREDEVMEKEAEVEAKDFWEREGRSMLGKILNELKEKPS